MSHAWCSNVYPGVFFFKTSLHIPRLFKIERQVCIICRIGQCQSAMLFLDLTQRPSLNVFPAWKLNLTYATISSCLSSLPLDSCLSGLFVFKVHFPASRTDTSSNTTNNRVLGPNWASLSVRWLSKSLWLMPCDLCLELPSVGVQGWGEAVTKYLQHLEILLQAQLQGC